MVRMLRFVLLSHLLVLICTAQNKRGPAAITGTVTYRERMALPPSAIVKVVLEDVSRQDAPAREISQTTFQTAGKNVPFPFRILFDQSDIDEKHRYAVRATILLNDKMIFTSTQSYPVITYGAANKADLVLQAATPARTGDVTPLEDTRWELTEAGGNAVQKGGGEPANITLHADGKRVSGSTGCNRLTGSYELNANALHFKPLATTRMACPEPLMRQEQAVTDALGAATGYKVQGNTLELLAGQRVVARFQSSQEHR